jgi:hypothetical protein
MEGVAFEWRDCLVIYQPKGSSSLIARTRQRHQRAADNQSLTDYAIRT